MKRTSRFLPATARGATRVLLVVVALGCSTEPAVAPSVDAGPLASTEAVRDLRFVPIDVPGARMTAPQGIGPSGEIVGTYVDATGKSRGFLLSRGEFTTLDVPGAVGTQARGIGPDGVIVGSYRLPNEPMVATHGFRRSADGEFTGADYPGHLYTIPQRILPDGTILGCRHDQDMMGTMRGVAFGGGTTTEIEAYASMTNGATPDGRRQVGLWANMMTNRSEGFIIDDGVFRSLVVPNSSMTAAWDVNPRGDVAGVYRDATGFHGFVLRGDEIVTIDYPGASATRVFGINAAGEVVGTYVMGGRTRGFAARLTGR